MPRALRRLATALLITVTLGASAHLLAQATASDFYLGYRKALASAKKVEDIFPFVSEKTKKQMLATPAAQRGPMFEMMKMMNDLSDVKITKETRTATGATLTVEGIDMDKAKSVGTVTIVTENGAFKVGSESWSTH